MITQIVLGDDTRGLSTVVKPRAGVAFQGLNVAGAVRAVSDPIPGQDGSLDLTENADVAAVTLQVQVTGQFRGFLDELAQYCAPFARPYLEVTDDEWAGPRRLSLRFDSNNSPIQLGTGQSRVVQLAWKVPSGTWDDSNGVSYTVPASATPTSGLTFSASTSGLDAPAGGYVIHGSTVGSDTIVTNPGALKPPWTAQLYGPCTGPALYNDTSGQGIVFTDALVLGAGEYVELDSAARTANFLSNPDEGRLLYLDYENTDWFDLEPGANQVRYAPDAVGRPSFVPGISFGAFMTAATLGATDFNGWYAAWQAMGGRPLSAQRWYMGTTYTIGTGSLSQMIAAGMKVCLDFTPASPGTSADYNSLLSLMQALKAAGATVEVSLWHEPSGAGLTAAQYVAMMKFYAGAIRPYYRLWCCFTGTEAIEANGFFPGVSYCDGIAVDDYATGTSSLDNGQVMADNHGLPLALWEFNTAFDLGVSPSPVTGLATSDMQTFLAYAQNLFQNRIAAGKPVGDVLFFTNGSSGGTGTANFLGGYNTQAAGAEGGIAHWVQSGNCSIAPSSAWSKSGASSFLLTATAAGAMSARPENIATSQQYALACTPGQQAIASAWFHTAGRNVHVDLSWYTAAFAPLTGTNGAAVADGGALAGTFASVSGPAPATTAWVVAHVQVDGAAAAGEQAWVDDVQISLLPASIDHTAPIQFPWDWRLAWFNSMRDALNGAGALSGGIPEAVVSFTPRRMPV